MALAGAFWMLCICTVSPAFIFIRVAFLSQELPADGAASPFLLIHLMTPFPTG